MPSPDGNDDQKLGRASIRVWFVYTLSDPRDPTVVRYVGVTNDPRRRLREHQNRAATGVDQTYCGNWKRALLREGLRPILAIIDQGVGDTWKLAELKWVAHFREQVGDRLCNLTEGGSGTRGHVCTPETRDKIRRIHLGMKASDAAKASMSRAQTGKKAKESTRVKQSKAHRGVPKSAEHRARISESLMGNQNGLGRKDSAEARAQRGLAIKASWDRRKNANGGHNA